MVARVERDPKNGFRNLEPLEGQEPVDYYLTEIKALRKELPVLTADEERRRARRIEAGKRAENELRIGQNLSATRVRRLLLVKKAGEEARQKFIKENLGLVPRVAKRYLGRGVEYTDLIQEGNIGLMHAIEKFDWRLGFKFSTYATGWIRQAIGRAVHDHGRTIRIPIHVQEKMGRLAQAQRVLSQRLEREPTRSELAGYLGISPGRVRELEIARERPVSLESPVHGEDGDEAVLADFIDDESANTEETVETRAQTMERKRMLERLLRRLSPGERRCLEMRYGFGDGEPMTLEEIGRVMGFTRERARQVVLKAEAKLKGGEMPPRKRYRRDGWEGPTDLFEWAAQKNE